VRFRAWLLLFVLGGLGGAALDQIHVQSGILSYPHPWALDQAWWVAPQFGVAVVVMVVGSSPLARRTSLRASGVVLVDGAWFVAAYGASGLWGRHHAGVLAAVLGVSWLARMAVRRDRNWLVLAGVLLAAGGVLYEGTVAGAGAFHYTRPDVYHVPVWLAGIYLHGAPVLIDAAGRLTGRPVNTAAGRP
jgi:hypothetical protein